jgi:hypothetical protein
MNWWLAPTSLVQDSLVDNSLVQYSSSITTFMQPYNPTTLLPYPSLCMSAARVRAQRVSVRLHFFVIWVWVWEWELSVAYVPWKMMQKIHIGPKLFPYCIRKLVGLIRPVTVAGTGLTMANSMVPPHRNVPWSLSSLESVGDGRPDASRPEG